MQVSAGTHRVARAAPLGPSASNAPVYTPRRPEHGVLHRVVREHLETFLGEARRRSSGTGLPRFVERELREFLTCGALACGFARLRCEQCKAEHLVAFSCKGRAFCPSCSGRRMAEGAADLTERVLPHVPVRQWVLTLPHRLRYLLAWDHALCREVLGVYVRSVLGLYRRRSKRAGVVDGRGGAVTVIQRFGSGLNLNVHFHTLVLDGVFTEDAHGALAFHKAKPPRDAEIARLLVTIRRRILRLLESRGRALNESSAAPDAMAEESPALAGISAASVAGRVALGRRAGARALRVGSDPEAPSVALGGPCQAHLEGFDLHAALSIGANDRGRLEHLCRYLLRPPISEKRLRLLADGRVQLALKHPWSDGTTHLVFEPLELLERLASIIPKPRTNQIIYHGVLAAHARLRPAAVKHGSPGDPQSAESEPATTSEDAAAADPRPESNPHPGALPPPPTEPPPPARAAEPTPALLTGRPRKPRQWAWADLMRHSFGFDVLVCRRCGGRMRLLATIEDRKTIRRILAHLGLPTEVPRPLPARSPPRLPGQLELTLEPAE